MDLTDWKIVTYMDINTDVDTVRKIFGVPSDVVVDAVEALRDGKTLPEDKILHFDGIGSSAIPNSVLTEVANKMNMMSLNIDNIVGKRFSTDEIQSITDNFIERNAASNGIDDAFMKLAESVSGKPLENIILIKANKAHEINITGKDIRIAVLDSGIAQHPQLQDSLIDGVSFFPGESNFNDKHGHGTHCAGIIAGKKADNGFVGVAPDAKLYAVKIYSNDFRIELDKIKLLAGLCWSLRNKMQVVSLSIIIGGKGSPIEMCYANAVQALIDNDCVVVAGSGNITTSEVYEPANTYGAIAVGNVDNTGKPNGFSSGGKENKVVVFAPGNNICSMSIHNDFTQMSGTSMACAHVAGAVALIKSKFPLMKPIQIINRIIQTSQPATGTNEAGLIDCQKATSSDLYTLNPLTKISTMRTTFIPFTDEQVATGQLHIVVLGSQATEVPIVLTNLQTFETICDFVTTRRSGDTINLPLGMYSATVLSDEDYLIHYVNFTSDGDKIVFDFNGTGIGSITAVVTVGGVPKANVMVELDNISLGCHSGPVLTDPSGMAVFVAECIMDGYNYTVCATFNGVRQCTTATTAKPALIPF